MRYLLILFCFAMISCKHYHYVTTRYMDLPKVDKDRVAILNTLPAGATEIGMITARSNKEHKILRKAKKYAGRHGANGIYKKEGWTGYSVVKGKTVYVAFYSK